MTSDFLLVTRWRCIFGAARLGLCLAALSGCVLAAAGAGVGAVVYVRSELEANLHSDFDKVVDATRAALADMEYARLSENRDAAKAIRVSRTAMDKKVEVTLGNSGKMLTSIKIRVGVFGDEQVSMAILDKTKARF